MLPLKKKKERDKNVRVPKVQVVRRSKTRVKTRVLQLISEGDEGDKIPVNHCFGEVE